MPLNEIVVSVVGARPHFVKAYPLVRAMAGLHTKHVILHTGQHYDPTMSDVFFKELDMPAPDINLGVGSGTHAEQTAAIMLGVERALLDIKPKAVIVFGDTNSTLAATLAAAKYYFPLIHIEAGVRCNNRRMPEEINRKIIDHTSDYLICPSALAVANLGREGITDGVMNLGDFMFDTFLFAQSLVGTRESILKAYGVQAKQYILSTIHRELSTETGGQLITILDALGSLGEPVILPMHPRTRNRLRESGYVPKPGSQLQITEPVGYLDMLALLSDARKVVTDSGGLQKEAYWMGTPCVTIMSETTWPETIEAGWNVLVGADMNLMRAAVASEVRGTGRPLVYGPPGAAQRLVESMKWQ
ncbi:MAG: UDP-N-acetylglucosamine 2-epimerase [Gemmatimonadetes bacterium]|nr:UDP-N-acetylglucosamine 2-epimerase [Gemmatimonadota bacterium]